MTKEPLPDLGFIRLPEVLKIIPVSKSTFWSKVKSGDYPKPVKLSANVTAWKISDIIKLVEELGNE